ncbi:Dual-specificity kinase, spindle pole body (SPB) duplication and spindle checkpoint function [Dimargaris cristalligena]|nr:Dual-specificity kinase, spindle pole body (SPB) duplication and spindle checkpoint function [Dimargaris cristalligena]
MADLSFNTPAARRPSLSTDTRATASKSARWKRGRIGLGPPVRSLPSGDTTESNLEEVDEALSFAKPESDGLSGVQRDDTCNPDPDYPAVRSTNLSPVRSLRQQLNQVSVQTVPWSTESTSLPENPPALSPPLGPPDIPVPPVRPSFRESTLTHLAPSDPSFDSVPTSQRQVSFQEHEASPTGLTATRSSSLSPDPTTVSRPISRGSHSAGITPVAGRPPISLSFSATTTTTPKSLGADSPPPLPTVYRSDLLHSPLEKAPSPTRLNHPIGLNQAKRLSQSSYPSPPNPTHIAHAISPEIPTISRPTSSSGQSVPGPVPTVAPANGSGSSLPLTLPSDRKYLFMNGRPYTRLGIIGRGGSSKVYKVMSQDNKLLAVKKVALAKADPVTIKGYINEIDLLKRLAHSEYIIRLIDSEVNFERGFILIGLECGEIDLAHILQKHQDKPLNMNFVRMYWEQMLEAVHAIHEQKIVHSDLKPANFLLVAGTLKLIDFGIAKAIANDTTNIHREHQIGTVNYMSPEAIEDTNGAGPGARRCMKNIYTKLRAIPDPNTPINFPDSMSIRVEVPDLESDLSDLGESYATVPFTIPGDLMTVMKNCLQRDSRARMTIPELLQHPFLRQDSHLSILQQELLTQPPLNIDNLKYIVKHVLHIVTTHPEMVERNGGARDRDIDRITSVLWRTFEKYGPNH